MGGTLKKKTYRRQIQRVARLKQDGLREGGWCPAAGAVHALRRRQRRRKLISKSGCGGGQRPVKKTSME